MLLLDDDAPKPPPPPPSSAKSTAFSDSINVGNVTSANLVDAVGRFLNFDKAYRGTGRSPNEVREVFLALFERGLEIVRFDSDAPRIQFNFHALLELCSVTSYVCLYLSDEDKQEVKQRMCVLIFDILQGQVGGHTLSSFVETMLNLFIQDKKASVALDGDGWLRDELCPINHYVYIEGSVYAVLFHKLQEAKGKSSKNYTATEELIVRCYTLKKERDGVEDEELPFNRDEFYKAELKRTIPKAVVKGFADSGFCPCCAIFYYLRCCCCCGCNEGDL